ncbi:hypothetical protein BDF22DRAFT_668740 [Syncephalis plumigaleata]|nr:hypothetical protein BDF22DRAFT_668740 [Syncephalis plumigaleata]
MEELPLVTYYSETTLRVLLSQLAQYELQPNALVGLNLFLDDLLFRLLKIVDEEGEGHDGTSRSVVQAVDYALSKILPPSAVATVKDRAAERTAFVMMSQPREKRRKHSAKSSKTDPQIVAALERFPALRRHCATYLAGQSAECDWEVPLVVLSAECIRAMTRLVMNATISLIRRSQRNVIDVNELLLALSTDSKLEPLIRGMPSGVWMAEVVHVQVTDSRPDAGMMDSWRQMVRSHRTINTPKAAQSSFAMGHSQELRDFLHEPLIGLQRQPPQSQTSSPMLSDAQLRSYSTPPSIRSINLQGSSSSLNERMLHDRMSEHSNDNSIGGNLTSNKGTTRKSIWPFRSFTRRSSAN